MTPEQLIAEAEALLPSGPGPAVTKFHKVILNAADLPDAICRVMLASLRVAGVGR